MKVRKTETCSSLGILEIKVETRRLMLGTIVIVFKGLNTLKFLRLFKLTFLKSSFRLLIIKSKMLYK
jgi:hypothetical protein